MPSINRLRLTVNHAAATRVDAEVLKSKLEVRDVGAQLAQAQHLHKSTSRCTSLAMLAGSLRLWTESVQWPIRGMTKDNSHTHIKR